MCAPRAPEKTSATLGFLKVNDRRTPHHACPEASRTIPETEGALQRARGGEENGKRPRALLGDNVEGCLKRAGGV